MPGRRNRELSLHDANLTRQAAFFFSYIIGIRKGVISLAEGGAPYVFPDPKNVDVLIGFEVELAGAISTW